MSQGWLRPLTTPARPRLRVVLFAHAGGSPSTYGWLATAVPGDVEVFGVALPGRGRRSTEPPGIDMGELADQVATAVEEHADQTWVFFGHSMGALLAFETARRLGTVGHLVVLGLPAPHLLTTGQAHVLSDVDLASELARSGGLPEEVLSEPELLDLVLPGIRADLTAIETYRYQESEPLGWSITAILGEQDNTTSIEEINAWRRHTTSTFTRRVVPGRHFPEPGVWAKILQSVWQPVKST